MMQKLKLSIIGVWAAAALALAATAASADGYGRRSIKDAPCCDSWSGFYVGVHGGYGWKDNDFAEVVSTNPLLTLGGIESRGLRWGFLAGYNWQRGPVVGGLEIDFSLSNIEGTSAPVVENLGQGATFTSTAGDDVKYLGSARARLGFTPGGACCSNFLVYGTGGLAWERVDRIDTGTVVVPGAGAFTQTAIIRDPKDWFGWVAGVGAEARLGGSNWIGRIEYLHYDFGTVERSTTVITTPVGNNFSDSAGRQTIEVVRAALSYKF